MALINCPECGNEVSDKADVCPKCGFNIGKYLQEEKERSEKEEKERKYREEKDKHDEKIKVLKNKLFGSKIKKIVWIVSIILCVGLCIWGHSVHNNMKMCKKYASELVETYSELNGHLLDSKIIGGYKIYDIDVYTLVGAESELYLTEAYYKKLNRTQKESFDKWIDSNYYMSFEELKGNIAEYGIDGKSHSIDEHKEKLNNMRNAMLEEIANRVKIVDQSLEADGNYYNYTGKIQNNTDRTISYLKYTIYIYDENGNLENSDWSNWTGTFKPDSTIMVDTMIKRYDKEPKKYKVVIDEYS